MTMWPTKRLGELCDVVVGRTPRRDTPSFWGGDSPWITVSELNGGTVYASKEHISDRAVAEVMGKPVQSGTLLFSFKLSIGKMAVAGVPLYTNEAIAALPITRPDLVTPRFLKYSLALVSKHVDANDAVLGRVLTKKKVEDLEIPLPPLADQERFVRILDEGEAIRRLRTEADERTEKTVPAIFNALFGPAEVEKNGFQTKALGDLCSFVSGGTPPTENPDFWVGHIPWVSPKDMKTVDIVDTIDHISEAALRASRLRLLPVDTVLIVIRGMILAHTFPTALTRVPVTINQDMKGLIPNNEVTPVYLLWCLKELSPKILSLVSTAGHGTKRLDMESVEGLRILVPPIHLQRMFAARISEFRELETAQSLSGKLLDNLFQSLLHRAFQGEL
jgi:type I restriction enzyme, S subunit